MEIKYSRQMEAGGQQTMAKVDKTESSVSVLMNDRETTARKKQTGVSHHRKLWSVGLGDTNERRHYCSLLGSSVPPSS